MQKSTSIKAVAYRLLSRREHSRVELHRKLLARGFSENLVWQVLVELAQLGHLSDERFTESYVRYRVDQGFGPLRIAAELQQRGIDKALYEAMLSDDVVNWIAHGRRLFMRRAKSISGEMDPKTKLKEMRFLTQRGFGHEHIRQIMKTDRELEYE